MHIAQMKRDKQSMKKQSHSQFKTLSTKLLFLKIDQINQVPVKNAFDLLKEYKLMSKNKDKACKRMQSFYDDFEKKRVRGALKTWYYTVFDFTKTFQNVDKLADYKAQMKMKSKIFYLWRSAQFENMRKTDSKKQAVTKLHNIVHSRFKWKCQVSINLWKDNIAWTHNCQKSLVNLSKQKQTSLIKQAVISWSHTLKRTKQHEKYTALQT